MNKAQLNKLFDTFINYYLFTIQELDISKIPKNLLNVFHEWNDHDFLYSGSQNYRQVPIIRDWTTDIDTANMFACDDGFVIHISKKGFEEKFQFVSMDIIHDYLLDNIKHLRNPDRLKEYISESEVYAIILK